MLKIFDCYVNIKNRDGLEDCTVEMLENLDQMLTEYGVAHAFVLAGADEIEDIQAKGFEYCATLMYEEKDNTTFKLVYMLWNKFYRKATDETIEKAVSKMCKNNKEMMGV